MLLRNQRIQSNPGSEREPGEERKRRYDAEAMVNKLYEYFRNEGNVRSSFISDQHGAWLHAFNSCLQPGLPLELTCIFSTPNLLDDEVTVTEDKINALSKAAGVNIEAFWAGVYAMVLANVNTGSLSGSVVTGGPAPSTTAVPAEEKKVEVRKEASKEPDDDTGFGLFD
ncbi:60S acidic ribosomal protein P1-like [Ursus americanus]|uniref:60S acidic ribosomal protein P1-like n=1 Tax=Ursus americanus TaxID=9643 RepID=UPI001E67B286|nr:60S acidic ribosomal protein P1-like [Ursus americanus]